MKSEVGEDGLENIHEFKICNNPSILKFGNFVFEGLIKAKIKHNNFTTLNL